MTKQILGIHHVTAICSDAQRNLEFYSGVLGLRLVKRTVNFDDPGSYHLYYGDSAGHPGTIMTFFAWPGAERGRIGSSQVGATAFTIPADSVSYWMARLREHGVSFEGPFERFGEQVLAFSDPDGMAVELVASSSASGIHSATLLESNEAATAALLTDTFGFKLVQKNGNRSRYALESSDPGSMVDVVESKSPVGRIAVGNIHHIAWRTPNDEQQLEWLRALPKLGYHPSDVRDRVYFHSIYFREPGGILFEIATDPPGFAFDESLEDLGSAIKLPPWLEGNRRQIEQVLPSLELPVKA
jgi:catechol 2,3-dioxygenase-like lactoylglutathione lyase family enzyme